MKKVVEGSYAIADAVRCCSPDVISVYPITPQTHIVEHLSEFVANGELDCEYINVESEFSSLSSLIGASAAGARTYTSTTSQGLALMFEVLFNVSGMRLPIVMTTVNRALSAPLSIWNDQQDAMAARDAARLTVVVVLPTPPFWFARTMVRVKDPSLRVRCFTGNYWP